MPSRTTTSSPLGEYLTGTKALIVAVIHRWYDDWKPPRDTGKEWVACLCPFHGDTRPSASVSFQNNAFACYACGVKGDALSLIRRREGVSHKRANEIAEAISEGSDIEIPRKPSGKPRRRTFGG